MSLAEQNSTERRWTVYYLRRSGLTYKQIATDYGISRERVRQMVRRTDKELLHRSEHLLAPHLAVLRQIVAQLSQYEA